MSIRSQSTWQEYENSEVHTGIGRGELTIYSPESEYARSGNLYRIRQGGRTTDGPELEHGAGSWEEWKSTPRVLGKYVAADCAVDLQLPRTRTRRSKPNSRAYK